MENDLDEVEDGNVQWVRVIDEFYSDFEKRLEHAEKKCAKWRLKMNLPEKTVKNAVHLWYTKWDATENLWHALISLTVATRSQL